MMYLRTLTLLFSLWAISSALSASDSEAGIPKGTIITIGVEESDSEWPPFEYYERINGRKTDRLTGFTVDITKAILEEHGLTVKIVPHPWKRLLKQLEAGSPMVLVFPTSLNAERKEKYLFTDEVYSITPAYFYLKANYAEEPSITSASDLIKFKPVCGKLGYNYVNFGISNDDVIRESYTYTHMVDLLRHQRCRLILARYEVFAAHSRIGQNYLLGDIGYKAVPGMDKESFHYLITKNYQHSERLKMMINDGLKNTKSDGRYQALIEKYMTP